jgi:hypothetical protein
MFHSTLHPAISIGRAVIHCRMLHHRGHRVTSRRRLATRHRRRRETLHHRQAMLREAVCHSNNIGGNANRFARNGLRGLR